MAKIRLILVEDNRLLREGLTAMLNEQPDIKVVAAFGNGREAVLDATQELKPQIVLLDLGLRGQNSLRLVECGEEDVARGQSDRDGSPPCAGGYRRIRT